MVRQRLGKLLLDAKVINEFQLETVLEKHKETQKPLPKILIEMGIIKEVQLVDAIARQLRLPAIDLDCFQVNPNLFGLVDAEFCQRHHCLPLRYRDKGRFLDLAISDPTNKDTINHIQAMASCNVRPYIAGPIDIEHAIARGLGELPPRQNPQDLFSSTVTKGEIDFAPKDPQTTVPEKQTHVDSIQIEVALLEPSPSASSKAPPIPKTKQAPPIPKTKQAPPIPTKGQKPVDRDRDQPRYDQPLKNPYEMMRDIHAQLKELRSALQETNHRHQQLVEELIERGIIQGRGIFKQASEAPQQKLSSSANDTVPAAVGEIAETLTSLSFLEEPNPARSNADQSDYFASLIRERCPPSAPAIEALAQIYEPLVEDQTDSLKEEPDSLKEEPDSLKDEPADIVDRPPLFQDKETNSWLPCLPVPRGYFTRKPLVAIDFGTTRSSVAAVIDGQAEPLKLPGGEWDMPSVVGFRRDGSVMLGRAAQKMLATDPQNVISSPKRLLGRCYDERELEPYLANLAIQVYKGAHDEIVVRARQRSIGVTEICGHILTLLRAVAQRAVNQELTQVVFTAPVSYTEEQYEGMRQAASLAGLEITEFVDEPAAAALCNGSDPDFHGLVAIYDFGGGTFDFSVVEVEDSSNVEVITTAGDTWLGGDDFDEALSNAAANAFWQEHKIELRNNVVQWQRLLVAAEKAKQELSTKVETMLRLPQVALTSHGELDLEFPITRDHFATLVHDIIQRSLDTCEQALELNNIKIQDLNAVYLSGGTSYIPAVRDALTRFLGRPPKIVVKPERAVLLGAALYTASLHQV